uniref:Putative secreted protein n=1 Tax=Ixodes ricinus TaxID=34613 RepID=A0A6B0U7X9_IXORI
MLLTVDVLIVSFFFLAPVEETEGTGRACFPFGERWLLGYSLKCLSGLGAGVGSLVLRGSGPPACVCRLVRVPFRTPGSPRPHLCARPMGTRVWKSRNYFNVSF